MMRRAVRKTMRGVWIVLVILAVVLSFLCSQIRAIFLIVLQMFGVDPWA